MRSVWCGVVWWGGVGEWEVQKGKGEGEGEIPVHNIQIFFYSQLLPNVVGTYKQIVFLHL